MKLLFSLDEQNQKLLSLTNDESVCYCVPYNLDLDTHFVTNSYIIVTNKQLLITQNGQLKHSLLLSECSDISSEPYSEGGILTVTYRDNKKEPFIAAHFTVRHLSRISYVAEGACRLIQNRSDKVISREYETICLKCGMPLPGTKSCPNCDGRNETVHKFFSMCRPYLFRLFLISLLMLASSSFRIITPKVRQIFIDSALVDKSGSLSDVFWFIIVMLIITIFTIVMNISKNWFCTSLGAKISIDLRSKAYHKLQLLSLSYIQDRKPGSLIRRISGDTVQIRRFMENVFGNLISTLVTMIMALVYMLFISPTMTLISLVFLPLIVFLSVSRRKSMKQRFKKANKMSDRLNSGLQDVLSGMHVVKTYGKEKSEALRFNKLSQDYTDVQVSNSIFFAYFTPILTFLLGLGTYAITYLGGLKVLSGHITPGVLMQFVEYAALLYTPLGQLVNLPKDIMQLLNCLERVFDILDEEPTIVNSSQAAALSIKGNISFRDVTFGYKSYSPVLKHINLEVKQGEMIGLVGASGVGKSTLVNLLMRLYEVNQGEVLIDGTNIRDIELSSLHSQIGVVLQETFLFSGTILDNIRFAKPEATEEEIISAAKTANAHNFICNTPDGYNTYIGQSGYSLSGGERQRIAIARAILTNPRLLILDEATSHLDTESEYMIQKAIERLSKGRTTFAIAHRLSTLKNADRLVVLDNRQIAEIGSHEELIARKGIYYGLVKAQLEMSSVMPNA